MTMREKREWGDGEEMIEGREIIDWREQLSLPHFMERLKDLSARMDRINKGGKQ